MELDAMCPQMRMHNPPASLRNHIQSLELKRKQILQIKETTQLLKSRDIWFREGDRNTKFFHKFSNHRRKINSIWEITDAEDNRFQTQQDICRATVHDFERVYCRRDLDSVEDQIWGVDVYPSMFDEDANTDLFKAVLGEEILGVFKCLKRDNSLTSLIFFNRIFLIWWRNRGPGVTFIHI